MEVSLEDFFYGVPDSTVKEKLNLVIKRQKEFGEQALFKEVAKEFAYQFYIEPAIT